MCSAASGRSVIIRSLMDQPTTRRECRSITNARYSPLPYRCSSVRHSTHTRGAPYRPLLFSCTRANLWAEVLVLLLTSAQ